MVWNFGYDVISVSEAEPAEGETLAYTLETKNGRKLRFSVAVPGETAQMPELTARLLKGQQSPMRGWYSPKMFTIRPSYSLFVETVLIGPVDITTRVEKISKKYFPGLRILIKGY